ncbi:uncharacterized protein LOC129797294 [Lutzomyia longipalpis]|uniref:uncharacterized protein LOC129797294 n=1 Tax=Lutzomyia longipalpis TaxID=7200 RepID=UPI0024846BFE|nr:uncharacterized protein LOC129797294 [Lutzomyia longipalpis]XP_055695677.1 uncharacterized protein LOC129797294 [Lutzomyia longipalpis]XP_055695678.1 uncharacterized protein LOC129797294 [Lutzomyia longipalpis]XP_055695680.1 uncharacterized protein LOC129797294 [Lutzomyia longipalpis]XP_055695681.1 uncharacterized protein LOC129797294 [Lutzomyia longipalpis]
MQRRSERCFDKIIAVKRLSNERKPKVIGKSAKMTGDETFVISVDALREDGKVLKHFNIPIELPSIRPKRDSRVSSSIVTSLPLKKRYQVSQEHYDKTVKLRRLSRKPILKRMLQEVGTKIKRIPLKDDVASEETPLDLSRIPRKEMPRSSGETRHIHQAAHAEDIPQPVHYPVPLRYLVHSYPQMRLMEDPPPEVPTLYPPPPPQNARVSEIPRLQPNSRILPTYSYPHVVHSNPYVRPSVSYHHPVPATYYEGCPDESVLQRRSYHLAIPSNYAPVSEVPYMEDGGYVYPPPRPLAEPFPQYAHVPQRYLPHPPPVEVPKNPPAIPYSNQPITYAFHPPACIPRTNFVPQPAVVHQAIPHNSQNVQEIPSNRQRSTRLPSDVRHLRQFLLENAARQQRIPVPKATFSDEIPVYCVRNPSYNGSSSSAHDPPPKGVRYSHGSNK